MSHPSRAYPFHEDLYYFTAPVVVVLKRAWETYSANERSLLQKILTSVKVDINAVHIVTEASLKLEMLRPFGPARVMIFGADVEEDIGTYQDTLAHGFTAIRADDLSELTDERKKNLWLALRQMFAS
jgi:hypothetical protein